MRGLSVATISSALRTRPRRPPRLELLCSSKQRRGFSPVTPPNMPTGATNAEVRRDRWLARTGSTSCGTAAGNAHRRDRPLATTANNRPIPLQHRPAIPALRGSSPDDRSCLTSYPAAPRRLFRAPGIAVVVTRGPQRLTQLSLPMHEHWCDIIADNIDELKRQLHRLYQRLHEVLLRTDGSMKLMVDISNFNRAGTIMRRRPPSCRARRTRRTAFERWRKLHYAKATNITFLNASWHNALTSSPSRLELAIASAAMVPSYPRRAMKLAMPSSFEHRPRCPVGVRGSTLYFPATGATHYLPRRVETCG